MTQPGHLWVHLYFCLLGKVAFSLPPSKSLGNFTAWSTGRVPFWWSVAYVRAPVAIKSGNCGSIKHGYDSWGSLLCLVVSGGGSKRNRSWLAGGSLGEAIWKGCSCSSESNFCLKMTIIMNKCLCFPHVTIHSWNVVLQLFCTDVIMPINTDIVNEHCELISLYHSLLGIMHYLLIITCSKFISTVESNRAGSILRLKRLKVC